MAKSIQSLTVGLVEKTSRLEIEHGLLTDEIEKNTSEIQANVNRLDTHEYLVTKNGSDIQTNQENIQANVNRLDTHEDLVTKNGSDIQTNQENIQANVNRLDTHEDLVTKNGSDIQTNEENNQDEHTKLKTRIATLENNTNTEYTNDEIKNLSDNLNPYKVVINDALTHNLASRYNTSKQIKDFYSGKGPGGYNVNMWYLGSRGKVDEFPEGEYPNVLVDQNFFNGCTTQARTINSAIIPCTQGTYVEYDLNKSQPRTVLNLTEILNRPDVRQKITFEHQGTSKSIDEQLFNNIILLS